MFAAANLITALAALVNLVLRLYGFCIIGVAVISWVAPRSSHPAIMFLRSITEPVLYGVRRALPFTYQSGFDFSPIVVLLALEFLRTFIVPTLYQMAGRLA
ncbi:YggT family protein [bacterium]|nr:YggT family protein [bacterium]